MTRPLPLLLAAALAAAPLACTRADRVTASSAVSTLAPALCATLVPLLGADGATAGLVCADVSKALAAGLLLAQADAPATVQPAAARARTCTPVMLTSADPGRDPREYVCAESFGGEGAARLAVLTALSTGHAR